VLLLLTLGLAVIAAAVVLGVRNWPSDGMDAETVLAQAQAQEDGVLAQLTEGKALHQVDARYDRHGPAAEIIKEIATEWYLPERIVNETWEEIGPGGMITRVRGWAKDESGVVLQDIYTVGAEVVTKDVASGAEERRPLRWSVEDLKAAIQRDRQFLDEAMLRGDAVISSRNAEVIVIDRELPPLPQPPAYSDSRGHGYSIPVTYDIQASRWISRIEVDAKTSRFLRTSTVLVDASGQETVAQEWQPIVFEVVDAKQIPAGP
jgi:hypothetical protein